MEDWFKARISWGEIISAMTDEEAGQFAKAIWQLATTGSTSGEMDSAVRFAVMMASKTLKDDMDKRQSYTESRRDNGSKGGRPRRTENHMVNEKTIDNHMVSEESTDNHKVSDEETENHMVFKKTIETNNKKEEIRNKEIRKQKEENKKQDNDDDDDIGVFGLTGADVTAALERDGKIEDACRDYGLPCFAGQMVKARDLAEEYSLEWLLRAIQTAGASRDTAKWTYVEGVLRNWKARGGPDVQKPKGPPGKTLNAQNYAQRDYTSTDFAEQNARFIADMMNDD